MRTRRWTDPRPASGSPFPPGTSKDASSSSTSVLLGLRGPVGGGMRPAGPGPPGGPGGGGPGGWLANIPPSAPAMAHGCWLRSRACAQRPTAEAGGSSGAFLGPRRRREKAKAAGGPARPEPATPALPSPGPQVSRGFFATFPRLCFGSSLTGSPPFSKPKPLSYIVLGLCDAPLGLQALL